MIIGILKEKNDPRVAITPDIAKKLAESGNEVWFEAGCGENADLLDAVYLASGALVKDRKAILSSAELLTTIHPLNAGDLSAMKKGTVYISQFMPFVSLVKTADAAKAGLTSFSLDMIPRITIAQSMDVLSSMASIAGYKAVLVAASMLPRYMPMLTTAAGSIPPARVLVLGAGVAGLQAIATAKRLGAVVEAFDTRLAAKEEVESLGAKFVEVEGARDDRAAGGYAVDQTEDFKVRQREKVREHAVKSDVILCTALLRGKPAPVLITRDMVESMKAGSVIVDLASATGGNCELTQDGKTIRVGAVSIVGSSELAAEVPDHASQLFGRNVYNFIRLFLKDGNAEIDFENAILKSSLVAHQGEVRYQQN
jgi:H+-translocating NAD(P) transhydrogenase subunit alpha